MTAVHFQNTGYQKKYRYSNKKCDLPPLPLFPTHLLPLPPPLPPPQSTLEEELRDNELGQLRDQSDMDTVFRVQAKKYFMTYAGLTETELNDFPQIMALVQGWKPNNPIKQYIISREKHQHPADPLREWHIHLFVQFQSALETTSRTFFDLAGKNKNTIYNLFKLEENTIYHIKCQSSILYVK